MGARRRIRQAVHRPGAAGDGAVPPRTGTAEDLSHPQEGPPHPDRPVGRRRGRHRRGPHRPRPPSTGQLPPRRGAGGGKHRPGLGAADEARLGGGHRPRRAHVSCRHRQPRNGLAGGGRMFRSHPPIARRPGGDGFVRRGRRRVRLRRACQHRSTRYRPGPGARHPHRRDAEHGQPGGGAAVVAPAGGRHRPGPDGVHHQQRHQGAPDGAGELRHIDGRGREGGDHETDPRIRRQTPVLRRSAGPRHRQDRRVPVSASGHCSHERLQDQRIRQPDRRPRIRAAGGKPDAGVPRRLPLLLGPLSRGVCAGMRGPAPGSRGNGIPQRRRDDPVLPHARGSGPGLADDGRPRPEARPQRPGSLRDVRDPLERRFGGPVRETL